MATSTSATNDKVPTENCEETKGKKSTDSRWPEPIGSIRTAFKNDRWGAEFKRLVTAQFSNAKNPYECALFLAENSPDYAQPRLNSMGLAVFKEFEAWMKNENRDEKFRNSLTLDIQRRAFTMATWHTILLKTAVDVFRIKEVAENFVHDVRTAANEGLYREAAKAASALGVQQRFGLNEVRNFHYGWKELFMNLCAFLKRPSKGLLTG